MAVDQNAQKTLFDALYCDDEKWVELDDDDDEEESNERESELTLIRDSSCSSILLHEQDLLWDDEELESLFLKEKEIRLNLDKTSSLQLHSLARKEAVEWILRINSHYGFSALCAILAVNYLDRFVSSLSFQPDKPWMMQLVAVSCLSLAAKVEETYVPLLIDLQVEGAKYVFEAKTIQRMEFLVLSTLKWRMNPLTPLSFVDHIVRRLGLRSHTHLGFLRNCENVLLSVISDSRFVLYPPSVMATAAMLHVIHRAVEPHNATMDYENQLSCVLKVCKEELEQCYNLISDKASNTRKRTFSQAIINSPSGVMDSYFSSDDSSNDSWEVVESCIISSSSSSSSSSHFNKKRRVQFPCSVLVDAAIKSSSPH